MSWAARRAALLGRLPSARDERADVEAEWLDEMAEIDAEPVVKDLAYWQSRCFTDRCENDQDAEASEQAGWLGLYCTACLAELAVQREATDA